MNFLSHPRRARSLGYVHGMNANLAETLETYARGIIRGIHPIDSDQSEAVLRALNNWGWDDDLELYLPFDETSGQSAFDLSGNGNTGTATGTTIVPGVFGKARSFNGTSDFVAGAAPEPLELTASAWVYPTTVSTNGGAGRIFQSYAATWSLEQGTKGDDNDQELHGHLYDGSSHFYITGDTLVLNQWTHVAITYDGTNLRLYQNATLKATTAVAQMGYMGGLKYRVGAHADGLVKFYFHGIIDEPRFYSRALSADEFYLHYLAGALKLGLI